MLDPSAIWPDAAAVVRAAPVAEARICRGQADRLAGPPVPVTVPRAPEIFKPGTRMVHPEPKARRRRRRWAKD